MLPVVHAQGTPGPAWTEKVTLFDALWAFYQEHQYCGELDGGVEGGLVWMTCSCGATIRRRIEDD